MSDNERLPRDPNVTERDALARLTDAAAQLCEQGFADGRRWSKLYEVSALVHGIRTNILAEP